MNDVLRAEELDIAFVVRLYQPRPDGLYEKRRHWHFESLAADGTGPYIYDYETGGRGYCLDLDPNR